MRISVSWIAVKCYKKTRRYAACTVAARAAGAKGTATFMLLGLSDVFVEELVDAATRQCGRLAYAFDRAAELDGLGSGRRQTRISSLSLPPNRAADVRTMMTEAAWGWMKGDVVLWRRTSFDVAPRRNVGWRVVGSCKLFQHGWGRSSMTELPLRAQACRNHFKRGFSPVRRSRVSSHHVALSPT